MIVYRCDKCGASDDLFAREIHIRMVAPERATMSTPDRDLTIHLCGWHATKFREWLKEGSE
jgi:hypothetical protein